METVDTSTKIKCLVDMALKSEISWHAVDSAINCLSPTLEKSRHIIRILLKEFQRHQSICLIKNSNDETVEDNIVIDEDQYILDEVKDENDSELIEEKIDPEDLIVRKSELQDYDFEIEDDYNESEDVLEEELIAEDFTNVNEHDFNEADSEAIEVFRNNDFSKNIPLVESYKGNIFVGDDTENQACNANPCPGKV